jgi:drug/metabolite transporter (DMT)-like permease
MIKYTEYKYHLAALFSVAVWGATFVSTKVLIANSLTPAEIFLLRFAMAYICIWPLSGRRLWASGWRDEMTLAVAGITGGSLYFLTENMALEYAPASNVCTPSVGVTIRQKKSLTIGMRSSSPPSSLI